ncbi:CvpA family protein [Candidatus Agathobaculum pullicola]|uniref:CvpA family protein n=1 Tax=Candidatus Agathobaculum pullicola TaxID=2838426 RepID=UPI003F8F04CD
MLTDVLSVLTRLCNLPDLIILVILLVNLILGFRRGFFGALTGLVGRVIAVAAAFFAARAAAPYVSKWVVTPIVGDIFKKQAGVSGAAGALDALRQTATEAAVSMAESVAFVLLLILFCILFGWLVELAAKSLHAIAHLTPLGIVDSLAGGAVGLVAGAVLVALLLLGIWWVYPIAYSPLGWLSPERVSHSVLLKALVDILPVAI